MADKALPSSPASTSWQEKWLAREYEPLLLYSAAFSFVMLIINFSLVSLLALYQRRSRQALKARPSERETIIAALDTKVLCVVKKLQYVSVAYFVHAAVFMAMDFGLMFADMTRIDIIAGDLESPNTSLYRVAGLFTTFFLLAIGVTFARQFNRLIGKITSLQVAALAFVVKRSESHDHLTSSHRRSPGSRISEASIITQHLSMILSALTFAASAWIPWTFFQPSDALCFTYVVIYNIVFHSAAMWLLITYDVAYRRCSEPLTAEIRQMFALENSGAADAPLALPANDTKKEIADII